MASTQITHPLSYIIDQGWRSKCGQHFMFSYSLPIYGLLFLHQPMSTQHAQYLLLFLVAGAKFCPVLKFTELPRA